MVSLVQRWLAVPMLLIGVCASVAAAQTGSISGRVTDAQAGTAISDVRVEARGGGTVQNALTTVTGSYRMGALPAGSYTVSFSRVGYAPSSVQVTVTAGAVATADAQLTPVAIELNPTIITAGRQEEKALEAPASVAVVPERDIEERPTMTLNDQLRSVQGVDQASTGLVTNNTVTRGFNNVFSGSMLTLTDNRYAFVPSLRVNTSFLVPTATEDVGRIEVLLGPASALYGPNSANGVMHIITKTPFEAPGTTVSLGGGARSSSLGMEEDFADKTFSRFALRHAGTGGERFGYKLSGSYTQGTDWAFQDPNEPSGARDFDINRWALEGRTDFRPNDQTDIVLGAGATQAGSAIEMTGLGAAQVKDWRYTYVQGRMRWNRLFAQAFANLSDAGETFLLRSGQPIVDESRMLVGQIQHGFMFGERIDLIYGIDAQRTDPRTGGTINGRNEDLDEITEIGGYLHSETALTDNLDLFAAIRVDDHSELADPVWSPRAALVFTPTDNHSLRFSFNRAFSTPSTNNLFLDIRVQKLNPALPYDIRTVGVPTGGLEFDRSCAGGLCMRSPFTADPTATRAVDISGVWAPFVAFMQAQGVNLASVPAPTAQMVGTHLRVLNTANGTFTPVTAADVMDIEQIKPTTNEVFEFGYRGLLGTKLLLAANVYREERTNFIGPLIVETPNVFVDSASLANYLTAVFTAGGMPPAQAQAQARGIANGVKGVPLGTVTPTSNLTNTPDLYLTYRNFGTLDLWGADAAIEALLTDRFSLLGTISWASDDFFPRSEVGGLSDIALNAPKTRGSAALRYRDDRLTTSVRGRFTQGFPMNSGVYVGNVEGYSLMDLNVSYRLPIGAQQTLLTLDIQNALNDKHQEFVGAPFLGRVIFLQAQYQFGARRP